MVRLKNRYALLSLTFKDGRAEAGSAAQFLTSLKAVIQLEYGAFGLAEAQPTLSGMPQAPVATCWPCAPTDHSTEPEHTTPLQ